MRSIEGKTALVTGAGSGIGRATALALAQAGARLVLCDVDAEKLAGIEEELGQDGACLLARQVDVSDRAAMEKLAREVHELVPALDILINNAGVYLTGGLLDLSLEDWDWIVKVNLWGVIHGCHFFVPKMVARGEEAHVVNLASMYGYWPSPEVIGYLTTKFGIFGFSRALYEDLRGTQVSVSTVCPGMINTGIVDSMRIRNTGEAEATRRELHAMYDRRNCTPEHVAKDIVKAIRCRRGLVLSGIESKIIYRLERFFPRLSRLIARNAAQRMFR